MTTAIPNSRRLAIHVLGAAAVLLGLVAPAMAQVDQNLIRAQQRKSRETQFQSFQNNARNMPKLDVKHIEEVFQIRLQDDKTLACVSPAMDKEKTRTLQYRLEL